MEEENQTRPKFTALQSESHFGVVCLASPLSSSPAVRTCICTQLPRHAVEIRSWPIPASIRATTGKEAASIGVCDDRFGGEQHEFGLEFHWPESS